MAREIVHGDLDAKLLLLYGSNDEDDIIYYDLFKTLEAESEGKVKVVHVLSCEETSLEGCELGFITADIIKEYSDVDNSSFFICGPQAMYEFVAQELETFNLPPRQVRWEVYGEVDDIAQKRRFPTERQRPGLPNHRPHWRITTKSQRKPRKPSSWRWNAPTWPHPHSAVRENAASVTRSWSVATCTSLPIATAVAPRINSSATSIRALHTRSPTWKSPYHEMYRARPLTCGIMLKDSQNRESRCMNPQWLILPQVRGCNAVQD